MHSVGLTQHQLWFVFYFNMRISLIEWYCSRLFRIIWTWPCFSLELKSFKIGKDTLMFFSIIFIITDLFNRFSQGHNAPTLDNQQDFCVIRTNTTDKNIYAAFERFLTTGDTKDISFTSNVYLMFAVGSYTFTNSYNPQQHSFRTSYQTSISLLNCASSM